MVRRWMLNPKWLMAVPLLLVLGIATACGGDDATPQVIERIVEVTKIVKEEVIVTKEVIKEVMAPSTYGLEPYLAGPAPAAAFLPPADISEAGGPAISVGTGKHGGTLGSTAPMVPPHFDLDQQSAGTILWATAGGLYNSLIAYNHEDGGFSYVPELATSWDISEDSKQFTFHLRDDVKFHDGSVMDSADVVASFDRRINPPEGILIFKGHLFNAFKSVSATDASTVVFEMDFPTPMAFEAIAQDGSVVFSSDELAANDNNFRKLAMPTGTGPFKFVEYIPKEKWVVEKNENYHVENLPYLDRHEGIPSSIGKRGATVFAGIVDIGIYITPEEIRLAKEKGFPVMEPPANIIQGVLINTEHPLFSNKKVRQAVDLVLQRRPLLDMVGINEPVSLGRWVPPKTRYTRSDEELLAMPAIDPSPDGILEAVRLAKALMIEAGYPPGSITEKIDFTYRSSVAFAMTSPAMQQMMNAIGIPSTIRFIDYSTWPEDIRTSDWAMTLTHIGADTFDPSDYMNSYYHSEGGNNFMNYSNPQVDSLLGQIDRELDADKRKGLMEQVQAILDEDVPSIVYAWEGQPWTWYPYVNGITERLATATGNMIFGELYWTDQ